MAIPEPIWAESARPCWSGYVAVDDVDSDAAHVWVAGGAIRRGPEDIPNVGRFALASNPGGAVFLLFKPNIKEAAKPVAPMIPGHVGWHELIAGDLDREFAFYARLFRYCTAPPRFPAARGSSRPATPRRRVRDSKRTQVSGAACPTLLRPAAFPRQCHNE